MALVQKNRQGDILKAQLKGILDETFHFEREIGSSMKELHLNCREVIRINSLAVKAWREYFHALRCKSVKVKLIELSPVLVAQLNAVMEFALKSEIASICVPFFCSVCSQSNLETFELAVLSEFLDKPKKVHCQKCKGLMECDEIIEEYLAFLDDPAFV